MKCEKCGKNQANYHYTSNINGVVTETHLCSECACESGMEQQLFSGVEQMFTDLFDGFFGRSRHSLLDSFGFGMPTLLMPRIEIRVDPEISENKQASPEADTRKQAQVDGKMQRRREINQLRHQMHEAARQEDYEKAASLRDQLRKLEEAE